MDASSPDQQADAGPSMSDPTVTAFLTQVLCAHGGRLALSEIQQRLSLSPAHIAGILREEAHRFRLLAHTGVVLVQSSLRLCARERCRTPDCGRLHLCRYYVLGTCYRGSRGNVCPYSHDIQSEANKVVLKANELHYLDEGELRVLLLLNDPAFLPEVCKDYEGELKVGTCPQGFECYRLHVCRYFLWGECSKSHCTSSHNLLDPGALRVMQARRLSKEIIQNIQLMRYDQCIEAQNALRNRNIKGDTSVMPQTLDLRGAINPFLPLFPLAGNYVEPSGRARVNKFPLMHQPVTQVPVDFFPMVPPVSLSVRTTEATQPNWTGAIVGPYHSQTAAAAPRLASTPSTGTPQRNQSHAKHKKKPKAVQGPVDSTLTTDTESLTTLHAADQQPNQKANKPVLKHMNCSCSLEPVVDIQPATAANDIAPTVSQKGTSLPAVVPEDLGDPNEICLYHIWKFCRKLNIFVFFKKFKQAVTTWKTVWKYKKVTSSNNLENSMKIQGKCTQIHYYLPYRWQIFEESNEWKDLASMEDIEKAYSNPNNSCTQHHNIDFQKMTSSLKPIRRLSTASSVTKPPEYILTTKWVWYWKNESGEWIEYGRHGGNDRASVGSADLESSFLTNKKAVLKFEAASQKYEINFEDMVQVNLVYRTKREILRRPRFVSQEDVKRLKTSVNQSASLQAIPAYWDRTAVPNAGYKLVDIHSGSSEFIEIQRQFDKTMLGYTIQEIKRIQNPSLWQAYQMQMKKMKMLSKEKDVLEESLFHGTSTCPVDAVCRENFDWRNYEYRPVLYGQGSYFSKGADYSHQYCQSSSKVKTMFRARVLVGEYVFGQASYTRPPPKPTNPRQAYDSCVDNEHNPLTFIIFEKHQYYPDYILEYTEDKVPIITPVPIITQVDTQPKVAKPAQVKVAAKESKKCCIS